LPIYIKSFGSNFKFENCFIFIFIFFSIEALQYDLVLSTLLFLFFFSKETFSKKDGTKRSKLAQMKYR
jgi:hypothetical protein